MKTTHASSEVQKYPNFFRHHEFKSGRYFELPLLLQDVFAIFSPQLATVSPVFPQETHHFVG